MAIKEQYQTKSKNFNGLLYRGTYMSEGEWSSLKENTGREIEMHGFLSVSKEKDVALNFMKRDPSKMALITIIVPKGPNEELQGFAEIEEYSLYPQEKEILFNVRSRFTVLETEDDYEYSETTKCRHLVLLYGAQGFRKFIAEKNPTQRISIPRDEMYQRSFFVSLKTGLYYGKKYLDDDAAPFLYVPMMGLAGEIEIKGCLLVNQTQTPFYGYKCCNCQAKKQKSYFTCSDCGGKEDIWCENCFETTSKCRESGHKIVLEMSPFSFWREKMSLNELNHLNFQNNLAPDNEVFQQASMYIASYQYEKAIEYFSFYIRQNETQSRDGNLALSFSFIARLNEILGEDKKALEFYLKLLDTSKSVHGDNHQNVVGAYLGIGDIYRRQGEKVKALEYYQKARKILEDTYRFDNPFFAHLFESTAQVCIEAGEYEKGLESFLKAVKVIKKLYGDNHPKVAPYYFEIGYINDEKLGDSRKALEYYMKTLDIRRSFHGDNDPNIATSYHNIGLIYAKQNNAPKALEYFLKVLEITKLLHADNHATVAPSYLAIGHMYVSRGEETKALEYLLKGCELTKSASDLEVAFKQIGKIYYKQQEYKKSVEYDLKALEIYKSVHGDNHPDVANSYSAIAGAYLTQSEISEALKYNLKALEIRKFIYGDNHADTALSYNQIGTIYLFQKEYLKALECLLKGFEIQKIIDGDNHLMIASSYFNIGSVYGNLKEYEKAIEYTMKSIYIFESLYGVNHFMIAFACNGIGEFYEKQDNDSEALRYYLIALEIRKSIHGDNHLDTASSYTKIGKIYYACQNKFLDKALEYFLKALEIKKLIYKDDHHIETAGDYYNVAMVYDDMGDDQTAYKYYWPCACIHEAYGTEDNLLLAHMYYHKGMTLARLRALESALEDLAKSLSRFTSLYGEDHPSTIQVKNKILAVESILQNKQE